MSRFLRIEYSDINEGYMVYNKKDPVPVGMIYFYKQWKKWIFDPADGTIFDKECLDDIAEWLSLISQNKLKGGR